MSVACFKCLDIPLISQNDDGLGYLRRVTHVPRLGPGCTLTNLYCISLQESKKYVSLTQAGTTSLPSLAESACDLPVELLQDSGLGPYQEA